MIVNMDKKGVSNLYRSLHGRHYEIIEEACNKWKNNANLTVSTNALSNSFKRHSILIDDSYAKYIQFRT